MSCQITSELSLRNTKDQQGVYLMLRLRLTQGIHDHVSKLLKTKK
jgi:hypothetical protein